MKRRGLAMTAGAIALATLSCQLILGLEEPTGIPRTDEPPSPGEDAGPQDPCKHASRPLPPQKDDDLDTKHAYWFATKSVFGPLNKPGGPQGGYDLDNACTCAKDLHDGGPSCTGAQTVCDLDGGIDDTVGALFGEVSGSFSLDPLKPVNEALQNGSRTLLLYMEGYNGKANDSDVRLAFINSGGLYTKVGCQDGVERDMETTFLDDNGVHTPPGQNRYRALWDGCDNWSPEASGLLNANRVPSQLTKGYVTNKQLVIAVDQVGTAIFGSTASIYSPLLVATINDENGHLRLDGVFAGRLPFDDMVQALGGNQVGDGYEDGGYLAVCESPFWIAAGPKLCGARDIMATDNEDFKGRACNATSLNFGFTLVEARIAPTDFTNRSVQKSCPPLKCP